MMIGSIHQDIVEMIAMSNMRDVMITSYHLIPPGWAVLLRGTSVVWIGPLKKLPSSEKIPYNGVILSEPDYKHVRSQVEQDDSMEKVANIAGMFSVYTHKKGDSKTSNPNAKDEVDGRGKDSFEEIRKKRTKRMMGDE